MPRARWRQFSRWLLVAGRAGPCWLLRQRERSGELDHGHFAGCCHRPAQVHGRAAERPGPAGHHVGERAGERLRRVGLARARQITLLSVSSKVIDPPAGVMVRRSQPPPQPPPNTIVSVAWPYGMTCPCPHRRPSGTKQPLWISGTTASTRVMLAGVLVAATAREPNAGDRSSRAPAASMARSSRFHGPSLSWAGAPLPACPGRRVPHFIPAMLGAVLTAWIWVRHPTAGPAAAGRRPLACPAPRAGGDRGQPGLPGAGRSSRSEGDGPLVDSGR